ncbi:MAG: hypothetical protein IKQ91_00295 [Oscillospiraceae bacterium]|nr:hypothetical protein [Oscillospiraceae bacterium]
MFRSEVSRMVIEFSVIGVIVAVLLLKKKTRKLTLKILIGVTVFLLILAVIGAAEFFLCREWFAVVYPFTVFDLLFLYMLIRSAMNLAQIVRLQKNGIRTSGTVIGLIGGKGCGYRIRYSVGGTDYQCIGNRLSQGVKYQCGSEVTVIYDANNPEKAMLAKEDLRSSVILTTGVLLMLAGWAAVQYISYIELTI